MPDDNPLQGGVESSPCLQHHMDTSNTATPCSDDSFQDATSDDEDFLTPPLNDYIWLEDTVLDRYFCIRKQSQLHYLCPYPCPYSLDQLHSAPEDAAAPHYEMMDLSDIYDLQDVMTTTSDEDILDLEDIFRL